MQRSVMLRLTLVLLSLRGRSFLPAACKTSSQTVNSQNSKLCNFQYIFISKVFGKSVFFTSYLSLEEKITVIDDVISLNGAPKSKIFLHIQHAIVLQHLIFIKNEVNCIETFFLFFQNLKMELENIKSMKNYASFKIVYIFPIFVPKLTMSLK